MRWVMGVWRVILVASLAWAGASLSACATAEGRVALDIANSPQPNVLVMRSYDYGGCGTHYRFWRCVEQPSGDELVCHADCSGPGADLSCRAAAPVSN